MRKTIIFGNGLGMALNPEFFSLDNAIGQIWQSPTILGDEQRALIQQCLADTDDNQRPHGEEDLDQLQLVISACEFLGRTGANDEIHWLSEHGKKFPVAVRKFIYNTSLHFHQRDFGLPASFTDPLATFVRDTKSHIATLNYDNLLYQPMIEAGVLSGYSGALVDGFLSGGFSEDNLCRMYGNNFGYYIHLHGSPLFIDRDNVTFKLRQNELGEEDEVVGSHIVLTHVKHKAAVISASRVLGAYWDVLTEALDESCSFVLVGYSGLDKHLNALLQARPTQPIKVVEWRGAGALETRVKYWRELLGTRAEVLQLENILTFADW